MNKEYFVLSNGIPLHVSESGNGDKVLLFLHGYLETLYIWEEFRAMFPDSYRIIAIDLPGHGLSGSHPESDTMRFDAETVNGFLLSKSIDKVVLIGHSMGGYVAQEFYRLFPEKVLALAHINSNPYADNPDKKAQREKEIQLIGQGRLVSLAQIAIPNMYAKANLRKCDAKIVETIEICETHDPLGICAVVRGLMSRSDSTELLRNAGVPVLFVFGDSDSYASKEVISNIIQALPEARSVIVPGVGHNSFIEDPQAVKGIVLEFLDKVFNTEGC